MTKSLKIFLVFLGLIISVFSALLLNSSSNKNKPEEFSNTYDSLTKEETQRFTEEQFKFKFPVDKKYLESIVFDGDNNKFVFFNLEPGELIKPVFAGKVIEVIEKQKLFEKDLGDNVELNTILIKEKEGKFLANYVFTGNLLVRPDEEVELGSILGEAGEEKMKFHNGTNLFLEITDIQNNSISLSKEIFE